MNKFNIKPTLLNFTDIIDGCLLNNNSQILEKILSIAKQEHTTLEKRTVAKAQRFLKNKMR